MKDLVDQNRFLPDLSGKNLFWSIKNSGEVLDKLKARDFNVTSLSTYDFPLFTLIYFII